jgi:hypothetical protein
MTLSDQIRNALRECGGPMSLAQLAEANGWDQADRSQAGKNLYNMKQSSEVLTEVADGKVHYRLNMAFKRHAKTKRGPGIHFSKADGARAPAGASKTAANANSTLADIGEALERLVQNTSGDGLTILSIPISAPALKLIDQLVERGLHGFDRAEASQRLIYRALEALLP